MPFILSEIHWDFGFWSPLKNNVLLIYAAAILNVINHNWDWTWPFVIVGWGLTLLLPQKRLLALTWGKFREVLHLVTANKQYYGAIWSYIMNFVSLIPMFPELDSGLMNFVSSFRCILRQILGYVYPFANFILLNAK